MNYEWKTSQDGVDWQALSDLYLAAGMGRKPAQSLHIAFTNSMFKVFVYQDGGLAAAGRVLADGADCAYLCDIAVQPALQGTGLGRQVVQHLLQAAQGHPKILLYAVPGKEGFYHKFGFRKMLTAMGLFAAPEAQQRRGVIE